MAVVPLNIQEFNTIAALIFDQLYRIFPEPADIDRDAIAIAMGGPKTDWADFELPSGQTLDKAVAYTIGWLNSEEFTRSYGSHPAQRATLSAKGFAALGAVPPALHEKVSSELTEAKAEGSRRAMDISAIGEFIGGVIGGAYKSLAS